MNWTDISEYSYKNGFENGAKEAVEKICEVLNEKLKVCMDIVNKKDDIDYGVDDFTWGEIFAYNDVLQELKKTTKSTVYI